MAVLDPQRDAVVIRVVYDGPPMAGKTTSVRALARGLGGKVVAPEEVGGRTLFFDWLDYTGGLFEGRRIRCQIVTVPGQATLASRRRRLLETADVVVFVGDSAPAEQQAAQNYLSGLRGVLDKVDGPPIGIVLQANKRDQPDAVPIDLLRAMLRRIGVKIAIVEAVATNGTGVREAFVFAVRLALDRVRELMRMGQLQSAPPAIDSAQDLLADLKNTEGEKLELAANSGLVHTRLVDVQTASIATQALDEAIRDNSHAPYPAFLHRPDVLTSAAAEIPSPVRDGSEAQRPRVPGSDLPSGMIWPPVNGRLILHAAIAGDIVLERLASGDWSGRAGHDWHLQSAMNARFRDLDEGRQVLVNWARLHAGCAQIISGDRCVVLANDGAGIFRLWQIIRIEPSLRDTLEHALQEDSTTIAKTLLQITESFIQAAELFSRAPCLLPLDIRNVGMQDSRLCFIGMIPEPPHIESAQPHSPSAILRLLTQQLQDALPRLHAVRSPVLEALARIKTSNNGESADIVRGFTRAFLRSA